MWFHKFHSEDVPSVKERYLKEVNRVTGVLEGELEKQKSKGGDGPWLVGGKYSYADLSFLPWQLIMVKFFDKNGYDHASFPLVKNWIERILQRKGVRAALSQSSYFKDFVA